MLVTSKNCLFWDLLVLLDILELVSSCDDLVGATAVVVGAVIRNDGTAANEVVSTAAADSCDSWQQL